MDSMDTTVKKSTTLEYILGKPQSFTVDRDQGIVGLETSTHLQI